MNEVTISKMGRCSHPIGGGCLVTLTVATDSQNAGAAPDLKRVGVAAAHLCETDLKPHEVRGQR